MPGERPNEVHRAAPHKVILHCKLNKVLMVRVVYRCELAHWDPLSGWKVLSGACFWRQDRGFLTSGGGNFVWLVLVHAHFHVDVDVERIFQNFDTRKHKSRASTLRISEQHYKFWRRHRLTRAYTRRFAPRTFGSTNLSNLIFSPWLKIQYSWCTWEGLNLWEPLH